MQPNPTAKRTKPYAFGTANMILYGVRGVMKEAWKVGHIDDAGVEPISPHDRRRTYIPNLLQNGNDLATTAKPAGGKSVDTTARYDRRGLSH